MHKQICPKCGYFRFMSSHHIYPRRYFGKGNKNNNILLICRFCHDKLEILIPFKKMSKEFYEQVVKKFPILFFTQVLGKNPQTIRKKQNC